MPMALSVPQDFPDAGAPQKIAVFLSGTIRLFMKRHGGPDYDGLIYKIHHPDARAAYKDARLKNPGRVATAVGVMTRCVPQLGPEELDAALVMAMETMQSGSTKVRLETISLLKALSHTQEAERVVPFMMLLNHDDDQQVKAAAVPVFVDVSKRVGGLKKCSARLVSIIGYMGTVAFSYSSTSDVDDILRMSRLACSVVLSAAQILSKIELTPQQRDSLVRYLGDAHEAMRNSLRNSQENVATLFFGQRLRCCMYLLQKETMKIPECSALRLADLLNERDEQCIKFVIPLIESMEDVDWRVMVENAGLLNHFIDRFCECGDEKCFCRAIEENGLTDENFVRVLRLLEPDSPGVGGAVAKRPEIWKKIPVEFVAQAAQLHVPTDAKYILQFPTLFSSIDVISPKSTKEDIAKVVAVIGNSGDIPSVIQEFPTAVVGAMKCWNKTPMTDWFCDALKKELPCFLDQDPNTIMAAVPEEEKEEIGKLIDTMIIQKIKSGSSINPGLWMHCAFGSDLSSLLISSHFDVQGPKKTKNYVYRKLYTVIESTKDGASAGALIGRISSSSQIELTDFPKSYDFLENFFNEIEIKNVPEPVAVSFLDEYLTKKFPNFEVTLYESVFETDKMSPAVKQFLATITQKKRESVLRESLNSEHFRVALLLTVTTDATLDIPPDARFAPYLCKLDRYQQWMEYSDFGDNQDFVKFLLDKERGLMLQASDPLALFVTAESKKLGNRYICEVIEKGLETPSTINLYLIVLSFLRLERDFSLFPTLFMAILSQISSLEHINELIVSKLTLIFKETAEMPADELTQFLAKASLTLKGDVVKCLQETMPLYISKFSEDELITLRIALSKGPVTSLSVFDSALAESAGFFDPHKNNFNALIVKVPNATVKWFSANPSDRVRNLVMREVTGKAVPEIIQTTMKSIPPEVTAKCGSDWIECEREDGDDLFKLRVSFPDDYPLRPVLFDVSSVGKDRITRECKDEVYRESLRPSGTACAISTWSARITALVENTKPCPICLSLLDEHSELPRARCFTCHQFCHHSCVKTWLGNSTTRNACPLCREPFKRPKTAPKKKNQ